MTLNKGKKVKLSIVAVLFLLSALVPPWVQSYEGRGRQSVGYCEIWDSPIAMNNGWSVNMDTRRLFVEWACIVAFGALLLALPDRFSGRKLATPLVFAALTCFLPCIGCGDAARDPELERRLLVLERDSTTSTAMHAQALTNLSMRLTALEQTAELPAFNWVSLHAEDRGFQVLDCNHGFKLLVSVEDTQPYLEGYKLILSIANPQSVAFSGCKLWLQWGDKKNKVESITEELTPGRWVRCEIIIDPSTASEIKTVQATAEISAVTARTAVSARK